MKSRNILLDLLKGVAIIAVMLYHLGLMPNGYLGVEIFLVIGGYLITKSMMRQFENGKYSYWNYISNRLVRLWPLLLLVSAISLGLGWLWMLPIHYKLNCEAAVGSSIFLNNVVQYITSGGYWTADNEYKPLMHTWYVSIMMQFYVVYPLVFILSKKFTKDWRFASYITLACVFTLSLDLYLSQLFTAEQNFYLLPSRLFEFAAGGLVALYTSLAEGEKGKKGINSVMVLASLLVLFLISNADVDARKMRLLVTVSISILFVVWAELGYRIPEWKLFKPLAFCGTASYSLYLFHQPVFAFYRYAFNDDFTISTYLLILTIAFIIGIVSYALLEKPLSSFVRNKAKRVYTINAISIVIAILITLTGGYYYKQGGLVHDIPELDLYVGQNSQTPEEYNEAPARFDKEFISNGRKNVLVIGDSFGRDWINILVESGVDSVMNISYHTDVDDVTMKRIEQADFVFVANNATIFNNYNEILPPLLMRKKFYRVGMKSFGSWIGNVYNNNRYGRNYFSQCVPEKTVSAAVNTKEKEIFCEQFIDIMSPIKNKNGMIPIFTDDGKLITQDGIHVTKAGAKKYSSLINVWKYLE